MKRYNSRSTHGKWFFVVFITIPTISVGFVSFNQRLLIMISVGFVSFNQRLLITQLKPSKCQSSHNLSCIMGLFDFWKSKKDEHSVESKKDEFSFKSLYEKGFASNEAFRQQPSLSWRKKKVESQNKEFESWGRVR